MQTFIPRYYHADPWPRPAHCSAPPPAEILPLIVLDPSLAADRTPVPGPDIDLKCIAGFDVELIRVADTKALHSAIAQITGAGLLAIDLKSQPILITAGSPPRLCSRLRQRRD